MGKVIKDLHGNILRIIGWGLEINIPTYTQGKMIFTKDVVSDWNFNLYMYEDIYIGYFYNRSLDCYIKYQLELEGYDESLDIRKSYLYAKKKR